MMDPSKPTAFFVKHSHIITSGEYKSVLSSFVSFIYDKPNKHALQGGNKIVSAPQLPFSDNEQSEEASRNGGEEDEDDEDDDENSDENYQES